MSGAKKTIPEVAEVKTSSMKVNKKEEDPILAAEAEKAAVEKRKAELQAELDKSAAELAETEKRIAEKRAEKAAAERKEKEKAAEEAEEEERWFLDKARESRAAREKLQAELGMEGVNSEQLTTDNEQWGAKNDGVYKLAANATTVVEKSEAGAEDGVFRLTENAEWKKEKSAAEQIQETVKEIKEQQMTAGDKIVFDNGFEIGTGGPGSAQEQKGVSDEQFFTEAVEVSFMERLKDLKTLQGWVWLGGKLVKTLIPSTQLIVLFGFIFLSWWGFEHVGAMIAKQNAALTADEVNSKWINAYNLANIQRMFFEAMNIGLKVAICFVFLFIVSPQTVKYILPFWNNENNIKNDLKLVEPWVRLFFFLGLFYVIMEFLGKMGVLNTL